MELARTPHPSCLVEQSELSSMSGSFQGLSWGGGAPAERCWPGVRPGLRPVSTQESLPTKLTVMSSHLGPNGPGAAAGGLLLYHNALGPILALVLVTGAGLQQDHGAGVLQEPTGRAERTGRGERTAKVRGDTRSFRPNSCLGRGWHEREGTGSSPASDGGRPAPL